MACLLRGSDRPRFELRIPFFGDVVICFFQKTVTFLNASESRVATFLPAALNGGADIQAL